MIALAGRRHRAALRAALCLAVVARATAAHAQADTVIAEAEAEERPSILSNSCRPPQYPVQMRVARIEGRVVLAFVVDTTGRIEPQTIQAIQSTHQLFETAARRAVLTCRFRPGRFEGQPARVRVQTPYNFRISSSP